MVGMHEMRKLVHDDVFDALHGLVDQMKIEIKRSLLKIAAAPARPHGADANGGGCMYVLPLPLGQRKIECIKARQDEILMARTYDGEQPFFLLCQLRFCQRWRDVLLLPSCLGYSRLDLVAATH